MAIESEQALSTSQPKQQKPPLVPLEEVFSSKGRIRILQLLVVHNELTVTQITNKTRLNHHTAMTHLQNLVSLGIIVEKRYGRIRIFALNYHSKLTRILINFIRSWKNENYFVLQQDPAVTISEKMYSSAET